MNTKVQQIIDHAEERMRTGVFSQRDIDFLSSTAYPDAIDKVMSPQAKDEAWRAAYREALPIVKGKWTALKNGASTGRS